MVLKSFKCRSFPDNSYRAPNRDRVVMCEVRPMFKTSVERVAEAES
jgi:hypothetical protein